MTSKYYRNPAMVEENKKFKCYNCNKLLIEDLKGHYEIELHCPRCKTTINLVCKEPISLANNINFNKRG